MNDTAAATWSVRFRQERVATWTELERIVERCERSGLRALSPDQLARLPVLYRATLSALSVARASVLDKSLLDWLENLVARAWVWVYAPRRPASVVLALWAGELFPAAVRRILPHVAIAALALVLGALIAFALVQEDPDTYWYFVPEAMAQGRDPNASTDFLRRTLFDDGDDEGLLTFAVFLFTHNATVGVLTYGLGFLFGVPSLLLLLYTGLMLGAMTGLYHGRGLAAEWWSWILPHGITELLAICLCGGAGLAVGQRLVFPGARSRLDGLAELGRAMGSITAGAIAMLLLAGMIEGVFRQTVMALPARYALATATAVLWLLYFWRAGRGSR